MHLSRPYDNEAVYQPAEDTLLLLRAALAKAKPKDLFLEIGCDSGFISRCCPEGTPPHSYLTSRIK